MSQCEYCANPVQLPTSWRVLLVTADTMLAQPGWNLSPRLLFADQVEYKDYTQVANGARPNDRRMWIELRRGQAG
jgi:hypothetical protein